MIQKQRLSVIILGFLFLLLIGCTKEVAEIINEDPVTQINISDYQYYLHQQGTGQGIAETKEGYYMINGSYLYYVDKHSMEPILLDNNPSNDCSPSNTETVPVNCNAYVRNVSMSFPGSITYYKDQLYLVEIAKRTDKDTFGIDRYVLIQMDKDGTNRKVIREFDTRPSPVVIHRDQIYFVDNSKNTRESILPRILTVPLDDPKQEATVLYTTDLDTNYFIDLNAYESYVYFIESGPNMYQTIKYNLDSKQSGVMFSDYEGNAAITGFLGNEAYFNLFTGDPLDEKSWVNYRSTLEGNEVFELPIKLPALSRLRVDEQYYYLSPISGYIDREFSHIAKEMVVYDTNYNEITRVDMPMLASYTIEIPGNAQHMFIRSTQEYEKLYVLDKSKLKSKDIMFELLVESAAPLRQQ